MTTKPVKGIRIKGNKIKLSPVYTSPGGVSASQMQPMQPG